MNNQSFNTYTIPRETAKVERQQEAALSHDLMAVGSYDDEIQRLTQAAVEATEATENDTNLPLTSPDASEPSVSLRASKLVNLNSRQRFEQAAREQAESSEKPIVSAEQIPVLRLIQFGKGVVDARNMRLQSDNSSSK